MKKTKTTKRALLMSGLALLLCVSMLVGSTYAWFTDSVSTAGTTIQSGTLKVDLVDAAGASLEGKAVKFTDLDDNTFWEPGCTYKTEPVFVKNDGNLALKYTLGINGINGDAKLLKAIEWSATVGGVEVPLSSLMGTLLAGETSQAIVLSGHMREDAGNEYQGLVVEGISFTVFATQLTYEYDSESDQYDKMATVDDMDELKAALAEKNVAITLGSNFALTEAITIAADQNVVIDLAGCTMSYVSAIQGEDMITNNGTLTVKDFVGTGKITYLNTDNTAKNVTVSTISTQPGSVLNVEGGTVENTSPNGSEGGTGRFAYAIDALTNGGLGDVTVNVTGGKIVSANYMAIRQFVNGTVCKNVLNVSGGYVYGATRAINIQLKNDLAYTTITGGKIEGGDYSLCAITTSPNVSVTGGEFYGETWYSGADGMIAGGVFDTDPSDFVVDGKKAVQVGDHYEIVDDTVNYATASTAAELQAALDNASNVNLIVLTADIQGDVVAKQVADLVITIDGDDHEYSGAITIDGGSATETTSGITLKNINFVAGSTNTAIDANVRLGDGTTATRYTCNVTLEKCIFDAPGIVGIKSYTGGDKNLKVIGCTATEKAHSLGQPKGVDGVLIDSCTVNSVRGINLNNSINVEIRESTFNVQKYAVRFGSDANTTVENYAIINCTLVSQCLDGDAVIVLRAGATNANLTITNSTYTGPIPMSGHENANLVIN